MQSYTVKNIKNILEQEGIKRGERCIQEKIRDLKDNGKFKVYKEGRANTVDEDGLKYILSQFIPGCDVEAEMLLRQEEEYIHATNLADSGDWDAMIDVMEIEQQAEYEQRVEKEFDERYLRLMLEALLVFNGIEVDKVKLKSDIGHLIATEDNYRYGLARDERKVMEKNGEVKIRKFPEITEAVRRLNSPDNVYDYTNVKDLI